MGRNEKKQERPEENRPGSNELPVKASCRRKYGVSRTSVKSRLAEMNCVKGNLGENERNGNR